MAYEIINNAQINPQRLYALVRLVSTHSGIEEGKILALLQPMPLNKNTLAAEELLDAAVKTKLIKGDIQRCYEANFRYKEVETYKQFRTMMQKQLLGIVDEDGDNYLLNLFTAWFAVKDEEYLKNPDLKDMAVDFNNALFPDAESRAINSTKLGGMDDWLIFLGYGWKLNNYFLMPDATLRLDPLVDELLTSPEEIPFGKFMKKLSKICPELDRGVLFEKCLQVTKGSKPRGNQLSLMLSTALRTLHHQKRIRLNSLRDASDTWALYPDMIDTNSTITHIAGMRKTV